MNRASNDLGTVMRMYLSDPEKVISVLPCFLLSHAR